MDLKRSEKALGLFGGLIIGGDIVHHAHIGQSLTTLFNGTSGGHTPLALLETAALIAGEVIFAGIVAGQVGRWMSYGMAAERKEKKRIGELVNGKMIKLDDLSSPSNSGPA